MAGHDELDVETACRAWMLRLPWYAFFTHQTAARVHGIPLPPRLTEAGVHVGVAAGRRRIDALGVVPHHLALVPGDVVTTKQVRVTSVERTWVDLAVVLTLDELVAAGDFLLWRKDQRTTRSRLDAAVDRYSGRRGYRNLRIALSLLTDHADSPPESEIRVAVLRAGLPAPEINVPIIAPDGTRVARTDYSWRRYRAAMEYEGDHHRTDKRQWYEDIRRMNDLQAIKWTGIRAAAPDYADPRPLIERLKRVLRNGGWDGRLIRHW